jgi:5-methylcytosine-specific restriction endonuclease McrA
VGIAFVLFLVVGSFFSQQIIFEQKRKARKHYYKNIYLKSEAWKRKRYVVLKRDNWRCVYCGQTATEVHHKRYAKYNIGKEPIDWLVSVCKHCHLKQHRIS